MLILLRFHDNALPSDHLTGHMGIIQVLSRKGIYIAEPDDSPTAVTETLLMKSAPFQLVCKSFTYEECSLSTSM